MTSCWTDCGSDWPKNSRFRHRLTGKFLADLKVWFGDYVRTFRTKDKQTQQNFDLKEGHTRRVCREIVALGKKLGLKEDALRLAEVIALLHDIGRFEQYAKYKTFSDGRTENHAEWGIRVLGRHKVLKPLDKKARKLILCAIRQHNKPLLERMNDGECLFFSRLLRDADKLDIWRVVTGYYHRKGVARNGALELELPDMPGISAAVIDDLLHQRIVDIRHVHNLNDYKLLQAAWIFDINFQATLDRVQRRGYLEKIRAVLPSTKKIGEIFAAIRSYANDRSLSC